MVVGTRVPVRVGRCQAIITLKTIHKLLDGVTYYYGAVINIFIVAGWSSLVARRAHNPKVAGSNPVPAIWSGSSVG
jgi:hypothetical protein